MRASNISMIDVANIAADYTLKPSELATALEAMIACQQPVMIWGAPGTCKSAVSRQVAARILAHYIDIRGVLYDPVDLRGIPHIINGQTVCAPPKFLPHPDSTDYYVVNLDELPASPPLVQAGLYQLTLDRAIGEYTLPINAAVIACGNREGDGAVSIRMSSALASRFIHIDLKVDAAEWCAWAAANDIAPELIFFIQSRPDLLLDFDPMSAEKAFPCPRTWEISSKIIGLPTRLDTPIERSLLRGTIGQAAAVELCASLALAHSLPHPRAILADPANAAIPDKSSAQHFICSALYRLADEHNLDAVVTYATRLRRELGEFLITSCITRNPDLQHTPAFIKWAATSNR